MGSYFDDAQTQNADRKRAILEAMAQGGSAGKEAYERAQQAITANRVSALDSLIGGAQKRNVGGAAENELAAIAGTASSRNLENLASSRASYQQNVGAMQQMNSNYMDQASAAVPAIQAASDRELALFRAQQQAKLDADAAKSASSAGADMPQWQIQGFARGAATQQRETAEEALARALAERAAIDARTAGGGPGMGLRGYETTAGQASQAQAAELERRYRAIDSEVGARGGQPGPLTQDVESRRTNPYLYERAAAVGQYGIDPDLAAGLFPEPSPKDRLDEAYAATQLENFDAYGARSPSEAVTQQKASATLAGKGVVRTVDEAARVAKVDPKLAVRRSVVRGNEDTGYEGDAEEGTEASPFDDAISTAEAVAKNETASSFNDKLAQGYIAKYGHDFPELRRLITEMYAGMFAGQ